MAISEIKKIQIIGHNSIREDVIELLYKRGFVEINDLRKEFSEDYFVESKGEDVFLERMRKVRYLLEFFAGFEE